MYNLTENQKNVLRWLVEQVRAGKLSEEFSVFWDRWGSTIAEYKRATNDTMPEITSGVIAALATNNLLFFTLELSSHDQREIGRRCTLLGKAYEAVDPNFNAPNTSFVTQLTPLADISNLDQELKQRCLPILGAGAANPKLWDSAVRAAGVILEERLRDVGNIADPTRVGRDLVNDVFGTTGALSTKLSVSSERVGYRDLYAGIVGTFRNPNAHRITDPSPEDGGAFIVFVNLLLKMLEDLR